MGAKRFRVFTPFWLLPGELFYLEALGVSPSTLTYLVPGIIRSRIPRSTPGVLSFNAIQHAHEFANLSFGILQIATASQENLMNPNRPNIIEGSTS